MSECHSTKYKTARVLSIFVSKFHHQRNAIANKTLGGISNRKQASLQISTVMCTIYLQKLITVICVLQTCSLYGISASGT